MKIELVPNWKRAWKFASVQIPVLGLLVLSGLDYAYQVWYQLPSTVQSLVPHSNLIGIAFLALSIIGRLIKFTAKEKPDADS